MNDEHALVQQRRTLKMSQARLAAALCEVMKTGDEPTVDYTLLYMQKRVSFWETERLQPTPTEVVGLAKVFGVTTEDVQLWFRKLPISVTDLFEELGNASHPSLVAICYGGKPRTAVNDDLFPTVLGALKNHVSLAMFDPYPMNLGLELPGANDLRLAYTEIRIAVQARFEALYCRLPQDKRSDHLALYVPKMTGAANIMLPPHSNRLTYVIELLPDDPRASIYQWVDSGRKAQLYRVGSFNDADPLPQMTAWRAYFGAAVDHWIASDGTKLPDSIGNWVRTYSALEQHSRPMVERRIAAEESK